MASSESEQLLRFLRFLRIETLWVPLDAGQLLLERQRARAHGQLWMLALALAMLTSFIVAVADVAYLPAFVSACYVVFVAGLVVRQVRIDRAERVARRNLPQRQSHAVTIPIRTRLGVAGLVAGPVLLVFDVVLIGLLFDRTTVWRAWTFVVLSALGTVCAAALLRSALTRPTLAIDPLTLTADDRLRTHDSVRSLFALYGLYVAFLALVPPAETRPYDAVLYFVPIVANLFLSHGILSRSGTGRWDHRPRPAQEAGP